MKLADEIGKAAVLSPSGTKIENVTLFGMGGSAFGGEVIKNYVSDQCPVPFLINRDYSVPAYVGKNSLVIISSYSGNTEETLAAFAEARERGATFVCVSSNGKVREIAQSNGLDLIQVPGGNPPRSAAGFSITQLLYIFRHFGLIGDFEADFQEAVSEVENFGDHELAKNIAAEIRGNFPILYSSPDFESVAIRWRQQIEENGKHICSHHVVPEMNHNELVGWKNPEGILKNSTVIFFESDLDLPRNLVRMGISKDLIANCTENIITLKPRGKSRLAQLFYWLHLGDWVSLYLAYINEEDPNPVKVIDFLKEELAKQ
ncbi:MAG: bifunctional phosphoglucose/phosphomannose isomerase [Bacteroidia bacterium]|nr:bifunctional phosphoglucose/phosphomannose isomerase [Bacteroidia bacterium]